ncbi:MAG: zf-CGNR multi-domain protein [Glaciihabitans sp.]|jgi:predicted RNA-binding Zn ribbon-like protein|nr:zf-CGNR multi-domain protein [Glaciihabitans sp.]MDQ1555942.1 hypothetical protein [Actinomycetota bacterium]
MLHTTTTGQWFDTSDGMHWWFDSGSVALDFAYTGGFDHPLQPTRSPEALAAWLSERFAGIDGVVTDRDEADAQALRAAIARMAVAASHNQPPAPEDVDMVNLFAATPDIPPSLAGGSRRAGRSTARVSQALSAMARESVELFDVSERGRIRECAADDCQLVFYDESRSNNRRWCSMQRCGNRAKVRAHRAAARAE